MYDAEAINVEQLATATDRLLLRGGQMSSRVSKQVFARGTQPNLRLAQPVYAPVPPARGSEPSLARIPAHTPAHGAPITRARQLPDHSAQAYEHTAVIRSRSSRTQTFAVTVVIPTLVGIAAGLAALL
jgi:hypothetical protein